MIKILPFEDLYNFKKEANSILGYKHTAIAKIKLKLADKSNHLMYRKKKHTIKVLLIISKPGSLNPMLKNKNKIESRELLLLVKHL